MAKLQSEERMGALPFRSGCPNVHFCELALSNMLRETRFFPMPSSVSQELVIFVKEAGSGATTEGGTSKAMRMET